jgi:hypothetical protein
MAKEIGAAIGVLRGRTQAPVSSTKKSVSRFPAQGRSAEAAHKHESAQPGNRCQGFRHKGVPRGIHKSGSDINNEDDGPKRKG